MSSRHGPSPEPTGQRAAQTRTWRTDLHIVRMCVAIVFSCSRSLSSARSLCIFLVISCSRSFSLYLSIALSRCCSIVLSLYLSLALSIYLSLHTTLAPLISIFYVRISRATYVSICRSLSLVCYPCRCHYSSPYYSHVPSHCPAVSLSLSTFSQSLQCSVFPPSLYLSRLPSLSLSLSLSFAISLVLHLSLWLAISLWRTHIYISRHISSITMHGWWVTV